MGDKGHAGFTLIELSIVLVIIGLIVGGVLVGQDLIRAAYVRAQISQIEKYNTAVNTFYGKYQALPGDMNISTAQSNGFALGTNCDGSQGSRDGNGLIEGEAAPYLVAQGTGEPELFWQDISSVGLIEGSYPSSTVGGIACQGSGTVTGTAIASYFPPAKLGGGDFVYVYSFNGLNWLGLSQVISIDGGNALQGAPNITVTTAYNIDKKTDDGIPLSGRTQVIYLCCDDNQVPSTPTIHVGSRGEVDDSTTCGLVENGWVGTAVDSHYSMNINNGAGANCALSFQFQ